MIQSETGTVHFEKERGHHEEQKIKASAQLAASDCGSSESTAACRLRLGLSRSQQPLNEAGTMTTAEPPMLTKVCNKTEKVANVDLTCGFQWQYGVRRKRIL